MANEELIRFLVFPLVIGLIGAFLSAFIGWVVERSNLRREKRAMQLQKSMEICQKIIEAMNVVFSHMKNYAWYIAWRKASVDQNYPEYLLESDKEQWAQYVSCLDSWRENEITYETELKAYFGDFGYEAYLFRDVASIIERTSSMVWIIYNGPCRDDAGFNLGPFPAWKDGRPVPEPPAAFDVSTEGKSKSLEEYFTLIDRMSQQISTLSSTMIHCIQIMHVGNLQGTPGIPVPESEMEEAKALLRKHDAANRV